MTTIFENPPAELEMELELKKIQDRYKELASTPEVQMDGGVTAKGVGGTSTAAYVSIYSVKDGTVSTVTTDSARKKITSGNFLLRPPAQFQYERDSVTGRPKRINPTGLKCRLHKDAIDRDWLDTIGLADRQCTKSNLPSQFMLQQHMDKKHHQEWLSIQREETNRKEEESRELQRASVEAMRAMSGTRSRQTFDCGVDGCDRFFDSESSAAMHRAKHKE